MDNLFGHRLAPVTPRSLDAIATDENQNVIKNPPYANVAGHPPASAADGNATTAWSVPWSLDAARRATGDACEVNQYPAAAALRVAFGAPTTLARVSITPGLSPGTPLAGTQPIPHLVDLSFSPGDQCVRLKLSDRASPQTFSLHVPNAQSVDVSIFSAYAAKNGNANVVSLSEIGFYYRS
jgi:hypothetical protein